MAAEAYEPLSGLAAWAQRVLIAVILLDAIAVVSGYAEYSLYQHDVITQSELDSTDNRQLIVGVLQTLAFIVAVVMFLRWFRRAYRNLPALGAEPLRYRKGWATWAWFVPIMNLFRPKQIANDIWRASDPDAPPEQGVLWKGDTVPILFLFWWAAFLLLNFIYNRAFAMSLRAETISEHSDVAVVYMVADSISVIGGILAVLVVRRTTARQNARGARLARPESAPSAA